MGQKERMAEGLYASRPCSHSAGGVTDVPLVLHLDNDLLSFFKQFLISPPLNTRLLSGGGRYVAPTQPQLADARTAILGPVLYFPFPPAKQNGVSRTGFDCRRHPSCLLVVPHACLFLQGVRFGPQPLGRTDFPPCLIPGQPYTGGHRHRRLTIQQHGPPAIGHHAYIILQAQNSPASYRRLSLY